MIGKQYIRYSDEILHEKAVDSLQKGKLSAFDPGKSVDSIELTFVGCVMYTFPFPSRKFVFSMMYVNAAAWSR